MSTKPDGGSAFPRQPLWQIDGSQVSLVQEGMTLRDYFAGQALINMSHPEVLKVSEVDASCIAEACYEVADAMLAERAK